MAKRNQRPWHLRIGEWIASQVTKELKDDEQLLDVAFRPVSTSIGPSGWSFVVGRTSLGNTVAHGFNIQTTGKPKAREIAAGLANVREVLDKAITKSLLASAGPGRIVLPPGVSGGR